jgi:hypothetical protein
MCFKLEQEHRGLSNWSSFRVLVEATSETGVEVSRYSGGLLHSERSYNL